MFVHVVMCAHVYTCRGQRSVSGIFFGHSPSYFVTEFLIGYRIHQLSLTGQGPGVLTSVSPELGL